MSKLKTPSYHINNSLRDIYMIKKKMDYNWINLKS